MRKLLLAFLLPRVVSCAGCAAATARRTTAPRPY